MTLQPCPDCGVLMTRCYDPLDQNEQDCWHCSNCGSTWTTAEIQAEYDLNAEMDRLDPPTEEPRP